MVISLSKILSEKLCPPMKEGVMLNKKKIHPLK